MDIDFNWEEFFNNFEKKRTQNIVDILNNKGIITDEDFIFSKIAMKDGGSALKKFITDNGYYGGELQITGKYYDQYGEIIAIFDSSKFSHKEVYKFFEKYYVNKNI
ncbi:hypothetical protein AD998_01880 [bacterium 336/3]|nr:hypothetical protein AD998_01880 [bacterium 336/3]